MFDEGTIVTEEQLAIANGELAAEQASVETEIARLRADLRGVESRFANLEEWPRRAQSFEAYLATMDAIQQKVLVQQLVSRVEIRGGEVPGITLRVPSSS